MTGSSSASEVLVFTDLDGTLLDHDTYQPGPAAEAVSRLGDAGVTVVFCSMKTLREQAKLRRRLAVSGPFIVENGAALYDSSVPGEEPHPVAVFGTPYAEVRMRLAQSARAAGLTVRGYGDMSTEEVAASTGLGREAAARARDRQFTETFVAEDDSSIGHLRAHLARNGLRAIKGARFWSAQGPHDKGTAVRALVTRRRRDRRLTAYGIGDFDNDFEMLAQVDTPMLVQRPDESWADLDLPELVRIDGVGPAGWCRAAERILEEM